MENRIYHNPRCSKSRQTLALLEEHSAAFEIIKYLQHPPTVEELLQLCTMLDCSPLEICRVHEIAFKELGLSAKDERTDQQWADIMVGHPKLIERPIVVLHGKAVVGRPPENVLKILAS